jgi:hypothetical protein
MSQESIAGIVSGKDELESAQRLHSFFSYLAQNPGQYPEMRQYMIDADQLDPEDLPPQMTPEQLAIAAKNLEPYAGEPGIGDVLAKKGRGGDTMMAHVNPQEMQMLQATGGSGTINPATGQPEFLKKFLKKIAKPVVGAALGFLVGGPVGAVIGGSAGYASDQISQAQKSAQAAASEQARLAQEFENTRIAEAQAEAERLRQAEARRQQNITAGQGEIASLFGQFNDDFYNKRSQSYLDFAMPTLDRQYQDQVRSLTANLARTGNLNSSLRGDLMGQLQRQYDTGKLSLSDTASNYANEAKANVAKTKASLMESNASLADPGTVRSMAEAQASGLQINPQFQSLSQMIADLSSGVQTSGARRTSASGGGVNLFSGGSGGTGRLVS